MDYEGGTAQIERAEDIAQNPAGVVKRWLLELKLADKREKDWRKSAEKAWSRYRQKNAKKNSFNILWANTETLRPAVYNSLPSPDVRRRYKDADPMGKACSEVLGRALEYGLDTTEFDHVIKNTVLDLLLPGRGLARVRYVPNMQQVDEDNEQPEEEALEGVNEEVAWEQAVIEHVQWDDLRISSGKEWSEVCWVAFRHRLTRDELVDKFGDKGELVNLDGVEDEDVKNERDNRVQDAFKTAEVWEIWDKDESQVIFVTEGYKAEPLLELPDPLNLQGFYPIPRPLYAIEDSSSLVPVPLYDLYSEQADELDSITRRINIIIKGLKLRGIYDSTLSEMSELMRGEDNELIPAANAAALLERGGLEKAIWFMPIEQAAMVLKELYVQREQAKAIIYEITGISDILRGASNANETATAQQIKNQWGSNRLKRLQSEVARFIRDLMRMQAEIIAEKFGAETLQTMTGLQFPMMAQKQQQMMQAQQQAMMAQQQGQQPQPAPQLPPAWEEILQVLRDDKQRTFKVDVETDSTIAASIESDMSALRDTLTAVVQVVQGFGPAVQMQAMPIDAVKEIILAVVRRAKLGNAVEDALDKIQQPQPQQQQQDNSMQVEQMKQQADAAKQQAEQQHEAQVETVKAQASNAIEQARMQADAQIEQMRMQHEAQLEMLRQHNEAAQARQDAQLQIILAEINARSAVEVAEIGAQTTLNAAQIGAASQGVKDANL